MSRSDEDDVWKQTFGVEDQGFCPCCKITVLYRRKADGEEKRNWIKGHIIPDMNKGYVTTVLFNMRAICLFCNNEDKDQKSNYHYSASIGAITTEEADRLYTEHIEQLERIRISPGLTKCDYPGCKHSKKANSNFCSKHKDRKDKDHCVIEGCTYRRKLGRLCKRCSNKYTSKYDLTKEIKEIFRQSSFVLEYIRMKGAEESQLVLLRTLRTMLFEINDAPNGTGNINNSNTEEQKYPPETDSISEFFLPPLPDSDDE